MFPLFSSLVSLVPEGGKAFVAGLHPEMLRAWLDGLSEARPEETAAPLRDQLLRLRTTANLRSRLKMLDMLADATGRVIAAVEAELHQARHPLSLDLQRQVVTGNELLKLHARCYRETAEKLAGMWIGRRNSLTPLQQALVHAMELESRRLTLAFRAYTPGSRSAWRSLHALHRLARAHGHGGGAEGNGKESPDSIYVKTLLTALAEPARLPPGELDRLRFYLHRHAALVELRDSPGLLRGQEPCEGCFHIRRNEEGPGRSLRKWSKVEWGEGDLVLDCGPLLTKLRGQIDALEHGALPSRIGLPAVARKPEYAAMLNNLVTLWSAPPTRRHARQHFRPRIELVAGFDDLWAWVSGEAAKGPGSGSAQAAPVREPELSEWSVVNESPAGFALQYVCGESAALAVGALAGLRPQDRSTIHICRVRRLLSGDRRRAELGLQKYAPYAVPTTISWGGASAEDHPPLKAIVLPRVPSLGGRAVVIVPPGRLRPGKRVPFRLDGQAVTLLAGAPIERCAAYEIFSLSNPD